MHERTQRAVARLLFVFCCAVPTSIVFASILITWTSWYQSRKLGELTYNLSRETGLTFQVERCQRIAPGKFVLENVRISDPESGQEVATVRMIDYFHGDEHIVVWLHQPQLQSSGLGGAWTLLHDRLISRPEHTVLPMKIVATDLNIESSTGSLPLPEVRVNVSPVGKSVRLIAQASDPSNRNGSRIRVDLFRNREAAFPATELVLSTEGTALPCSAIAEYAPALKRLGPDANFSGMIKCVETPSGWWFDLGSSSLTRMNLSFLSLDLPHQVSGSASLHFRNCVIHPGEMVNLIGTVQASNVRVKSPLFAAMQEHLRMDVHEQALSADRNGVECRLAAIDFKITDQTMELMGICGNGNFHTGVGGDVAFVSRGSAIAWTSPMRIDSDQNHRDAFSAESLVSRVEPDFPSFFSKCLDRNTSVRGNPKRSKLER